MISPSMSGLGAFAGWHAPTLLLLAKATLLLLGASTPMSELK